MRVVWVVAALIAAPAAGLVVAAVSGRGDRGAPARRGVRRPSSPVLRRGRMASGSHSPRAVAPCHACLLRDDEQKALKGDYDDARHNWLVKCAASVQGFGTLFQTAAWSALSACLPCAAQCSLNVQQALRAHDWDCYLRSPI